RRNDAGRIGCDYACVSSPGIRSRQLLGASRLQSQHVDTWSAAACGCANSVRNCQTVTRSTRKLIPSCCDTMSGELHAWGCSGFTNKEINPSSHAHQMI